jgi:hypothetical protein
VKVLGIGNSARATYVPERTSPAPESFGYGYCADIAICSVSILNFDTANCAAVPD